MIAQTENKSSSNDQASQETGPVNLTKTRRFSGAIRVM